MDQFLILLTMCDCIAFLSYVLNLIAKCIMKQFDTPKNRKRQDEQQDNGLDKAFDALGPLADELESESDDDEAGSDNKHKAEDKNGEIEDGTFDGREGMSGDEERDLEKTVKPVKRVLVKVCYYFVDSLSKTFKYFLCQLRKATYAIKRSTTKILPEWFAILNRMAKASKERGKAPLSSRMMPRDVETHWNYTYEMLSFAHTYQSAYIEITADQDMNMKMRAYELSKEEWKIVKDLADVLKASNY